MHSVRSAHIMRVMYRASGMCGMRARRTARDTTCAVPCVLRVLIVIVTVIVIVIVIVYTYAYIYIYI